MSYHNEHYYGNCRNRSSLAGKERLSWKPNWGPGDADLGDVVPDVDDNDRVEDFERDRSASAPSATPGFRCRVLVRAVAGEWLRKWRRMLELTLNLRPHEGYGQAKARRDVSI